VSTSSLKVKVVGDGYLDSCAITAPTSYFIQQQNFTRQFRLLKLKGHDVILGCDWIKTHSPICLDLRDGSRQLSIQKEGHQLTVFSNFTTPPTKHIINTTKLEKLCRVDVMGYIIQINMTSQPYQSLSSKLEFPEVETLLLEFEDIFANTTSLPPQRAHDDEIPLKADSKPPNIRPYRVPQAKR
jgi:hypothetical protein